MYRYFMIKEKYDGLDRCYFDKSTRTYEYMPIVKGSIFTYNECIKYNIPLYYVIPVTIDPKNIYYFFGLRYATGERK